jgi:hypothetical protein
MIQLHGTKIQISREGVVSVWDQYYADDEINIDDVPPSRKGVGGGGNLELVEISSGQAEEGRQHIVTAKYEGIAARRFVKPTYRWTPQESQEPIQTNPNWQQLALRYGGRWNKELSDVEWPEKLTVGKKDVENPMLGVTSFKQLSGVWSEIVASEEIPNDIWDEMWQITQNVPGKLPTLPKRFFLTLPPIVEQRGACYTIERRWELSGVMTDEQLEAARLIYAPVN